MRMRAAEESMGGLFAYTEHYMPRSPPIISRKRIVLTKGSRSNPQRRSIVERICHIYPEARVWEQEDRPHNRVDFGCTDPLTAHRKGKETLVLGEHKSAVGLSQERNNCCPNYWHFSPYGLPAPNCPNVLRKSSSDRLPCSGKACRLSRAIR